MASPRVLILRAAGVNCEQETAHAWRLAGAEPEIVHVNRLRETPRQLFDYQILTIPGGFSYGDDLSAGRILANELELFLGDVLREFAGQRRLILGICNGFQVLCKSGLLPGDGLPRVTITANLSGRYEDRWVHLRRGSEQCPFLSGRETYELPVAHGEGRVVTAQASDLEALRDRGCAALQYLARDGGELGYPDNPNGSMFDLAAVCSPDGRILGLMPHPERFVEHTHHPEWTRRPPQPPHGRDLFESAVAYFR